MAESILQIKYGDLHLRPPFVKDASKESVTRYDITWQELGQEPNSPIDPVAYVRVLLRKTGELGFLRTQGFIKYQLQNTADKANWR